MTDQKSIREKRQQVMEVAVMGVVSQGGPSVDSGGEGKYTSKDVCHCQYTSKDGCHCHIGFFLPEAEEGEVASLVARDTDLEELGDLFLDHFQNAHDEPAGCYVSSRNNIDYFFEMYSKFLIAFCKVWDLDYPGELL